jgi:membrane associated rhomboid family serine protease
MVTYVIMALCVLVFAAQLLLPNNSVENALAYAPFTTEAEPWRMLTSAFLHSTGFLLHIVFNMYALWILGRVLEPVLGTARYIFLYLLSAFGGSVGVLLIAPVGTEVVGASGAIFGLFGALFVIQRQRGGDVRQIVVLLVINAVLGFTVPGIAWQAHLGGLVTGTLTAVVMAYAPQGPRRSAVQWGGAAVILALLVAATVVRTGMIHSLTVQYGW